MNTRLTYHRAIPLLLTLITLVAQAEYVPDTIEFPQSAPLVINSQPVIALADGGAIEFWVVADWKANPGYHPVVLAHGSADTPLLEISIAAARDALIVRTGNTFGQFPFDFKDARTHHVAILDFDDHMVAFIDGKLTGAVAMSVKPGQADYLHIGSSEGGSAPFVGAISALRLWNMPLAPEDIANYALKDVRDPAAPHPELEHLVAISEFQNQGFAIVESYVLKASEMMSREEVIATLGEDEVRQMELEFSPATGDENE